MSMMNKTNRPVAAFQISKKAPEEAPRTDRLSRTLYNRRYLIPNAVTVGNMFCGFLALVYAASGRFEKAAIVIGFAILLDGLDGRVARRLNATSQFGLEFDSFCDLISFGLAPAMLVYHWCYRVPADEFGVFVTFVYALSAVCRLARFNIQEAGMRNFNGLPSPAAAGAVAALVYYSPTAVQGGTVTLGALTVYMLLLAFLMVAPVEYRSIKRLRVGSVPLAIHLALGLLMGLVWYNPRIGFVLLSCGYCLSGPVLSIFSRGTTEGKSFEAEDIDTSSDD